MNMLYKSVFNVYILGMITYICELWSIYFECIILLWSQSLKTSSQYGIVSHALQRYLPPRTQRIMTKLQTLGQLSCFAFQGNTNFIFLQSTLNQRLYVTYSVPHRGCFTLKIEKQQMTFYTSSHVTETIKTVIIKRRHVHIAEKYSITIHGWPHM